ncbi:MAG: hemerythrin family protein [Deltaproteobacteria bacterium]|nr:hemerythrin family protein [Deltaproteobacteria bacterium]
MALEWNDRFAVGVDEIDNQHKELFKRVNSLVDAMTHKRGKDEIAGVFKFLENYVIAHFGVEERCMARYNYPDSAVHKIQHSEFIKAFNDLKKRYDEVGASSDVVVMSNSKLGGWLRTHIPVTDKALGTFILSLKAEIGRLAV